MVGFVVFFCTDVTRCHGLEGWVCWIVGLFLYDFDCVFGGVGYGVWVCGVCVGCVGGIALKVPSKN